MTRNDLVDRIGFAERDLKWLKSLQPNCTNCDDFDKGACKRFGPVPPDFVQQGCDQWNYNDVPF